MRTVLTQRIAPVLVVVGMLSAMGACGSGGGTSSSRPQVVVTTSVLGDVVRNLLGDAADVLVIIAPGSDPHEIAPSARQVAAMRQADVLVVNGLGLEAGLVDTIDAARREGTDVVTAADGVEVLDGDPHWFTDPVRMRSAASRLATALLDQVPALDTAPVRARITRYLDALEALHAEIVETLAVIPAQRRILVTNHSAFGYFAARYDFDVLGTVIPSGSPLAEPSARSLRTLAEQIQTAGVPAIFAETSSPARLAQALAAEGAHTEVVELYTESLGPPGSAGATYLDMMRTDARRIAAALG